jgi:diaminohydroxyphosphoribosylaminopyrimidine deaminase/5-amino-6-(5-phosphoribosylamino)uracil reductase
VAGGGIAQLQAAGIEVLTGVGEAQARGLNRPFVHRIDTGRPLGILKWAMSLDGRTALPNGVSQWISGPAARSWVHHLRSHCDAVIVGGGTLRADDPLLTSRGQRNPEPLRVVMSRSLDLPPAARLWDTAAAPTLIVYGPDASPAARARLAAIAAAHPGLQTLALPACTPIELLEALAQRGCNQVLWECGPDLAAAAIGNGCVQEVAAVIAPTVLGGVPARTPLGDLGYSSMDQLSPWQAAAPERLGVDLLWRINQDTR